MQMTKSGGLIDQYHRQANILSHILRILCKNASGLAAPLLQHLERPRGSQKRVIDATACFGRLRIWIAARRLFTLKPLVVSGQAAEKAKSSDMSHNTMTSSQSSNNYRRHRGQHHIIFLIIHGEHRNNFLKV